MHECRISYPFSRRAPRMVPSMATVNSEQQAWCAGRNRALLVLVSSGTSFWVPQRLHQLPSSQQWLCLSLPRGLTSSARFCDDRHSDWADMNSHFRLKQGFWPLAHWLFVFLLWKDHFSAHLLAKSRAVSFLTFSSSLYSLDISFLSDSRLTKMSLPFCELSLHSVSWFLCFSI